MAIDANAFLGTPVLIAKQISTNAARLPVSMVVCALTKLPTIHATAVKATREGIAEKESTFVPVIHAKTL